MKREESVTGVKQRKKKLVKPSICYECSKPSYSTGKPTDFSCHECSWRSDWHYEWTEV
jgi:hypothetical protein